jgi:hypothetical protein
LQVQRCLRKAIMSTKSINDPGKGGASQPPGVAAAEQFVKSVATRHGFRSNDFSITWDGGDFDASRDEHELVITSKDGRRAAAHIADKALLRRDAWKYLREVDEAFAKLGRRASTRGL